MDPCWKEEFAEEAATPSSDTQGEVNGQLPDVSVSSGAPRWVTAELIIDTIETWRPYYHDRLTKEDALEILLSVAHLIGALE